MRIAFYGNTCNNLYQIAKALRSVAGIDAHLYIEEIGDPQTLPESDDPDLRNNYPDWIHKGSYFLGVGPRLPLMPWSLPIVEELSKYDLIVVSYLGPIVASFIKKPVCFFATGGDLTVIPFVMRSQFLNMSISIRRRLALVLISLWQQVGIRNSAQIWVQPFYPYLNALHDLNVATRNISSAYFPLIIDPKKFIRQDLNGKEDRSEIDEIRDRFDFVVFHPSRLMIKDTSLLKATGQWKHNDVLFQGFAQFVKEYGATRAGLVLIDRSASIDIEPAKRILTSLGLEHNVLWLKPPRPFGYTRDELISLYSVSNVVADEFGVGWFGSVVLEACATECAVISYIDEIAMKKLYSWHPILSANTVEGIAEHLGKLYKDKAFQSRQGELGRKWIDEFHSPESASRIYAESFAEIVAQLSTRNGVLQ